MKIIRMMCPKSKYDIKCPYSMTAEYITVHNTANKASAKSEISYMIGNNNKVSYHYAVDDEQIVQGIEENRNTWNAGDGTNGKGNRKTISIEICHSTNPDETKFLNSEKLAAKFIAYKLKEKGWGIDKVKKHQDWSGKYCPHKTLDLGWERFLNLIRAELGEKTTPIKEETSKKNKIAEDGKWGTATTKKAQKVFGTTVDGIVSDQYLMYKSKNPGLFAFEWKEKPSGHGSELIKAIQKKVGAKVNGFIGPETITKMQKWLGTKQDGYVSNPSNMVKAFQKWLNKQ